MCDGSVVSWLRTLRYEFEYYEPYHASNCLAGDMDVAEPVYANLWECSGDREGAAEAEDLEIKFGKVCRLSTVFCDVAEEFEVPLELFERLSLEVTRDVMLWKSQIRYSCCEEEQQDILESQVVCEDGLEVK